MGTWVDYNRIKAEVSFEAVTDYYQLKFTNNGHELVGPCPLPDHAGDRDNTNAFHISLDKNVFNCLTHCGGGNIIDFVRLMEQLPDNKDGFRDAAVLLQQKFLKNKTDKHKPKSNKTETPKKEKPAKDLTNQPLTFSLEKRIKYDHPWLIDEKQFPLELLKQYGIGWCKAGLMAGRIVFPIHNQTGELVAYAGRALTEADEAKRGKYLFPSGFNKSLELWNFYRVKEKHKLIRDFGLIIVEGFTDALRLIEHNFLNVVALMGWSMSAEQQHLILSLTDKIALFLDNDDAGKEATKKIHQKLIHHAFVKVVSYPDDPAKIQPEHFTKAELTQILSGKTLPESKANHGGVD